MPSASLTGASLAPSPSQANQHPLPDSDRSTASPTEPR
jgi:hypothetical protein